MSEKSPLKTEEKEEETVKVKEDINTDHQVKTNTQKTEENTKNTSMSNKIVISLNNKDRVEITNKQTGMPSMMVPATGKLKLSNNNVYVIPIQDNSLELDNMNAIKTFSRYSKYFSILTVSSGFVTINSIINGFDLRDGLEIGSVI